MHKLTRSDIYQVKIRRVADKVSAQIQEKVYVNANSPDEAAKQVYELMNPAFILRMKVRLVTELAHVIIPNDGDDLPSKSAYVM